MVTPLTIPDIETPRLTEEESLPRRPRRPRRPRPGTPGTPGGGGRRPRIPGRRPRVPGGGGTTPGTPGGGGGGGRRPRPRPRPGGETEGRRRPGIIRRIVAGAARAVARGERRRRARRG